MSSPGLDSYLATLQHQHDPPYSPPSQFVSLSQLHSAPADTQFTNMTATTTNNTADSTSRYAKNGSETPSISSVASSSALSLDDPPPNGVADPHKDDSDDGDDDDDDDGNEELYVVEKIMDDIQSSNGESLYRVASKTFFFLPLWHGYGPQDDTWEPAISFAGTADAILTQYQRTKAKKKKTSPAAFTPSSKKTSRKSTPFKTTTTKKKAISPATAKARQPARPRGRPKEGEEKSGEASSEVNTRQSSGSQPPEQPSSTLRVRLKNQQQSASLEPPSNTTPSVSRKAVASKSKNVPPSSEDETAFSRPSDGLAHSQREEEAAGIQINGDARQPAGNIGSQIPVPVEKLPVVAMENGTTSDGKRARNESSEEPEKTLVRPSRPDVSSVLRTDPVGMLIKQLVASKKSRPAPSKAVSREVSSSSKAPTPSSMRPSAQNPPGVPAPPASPKVASDVQAGSKTARRPVPTKEPRAKAPVPAHVRTVSSSYERMMQQSKLLKQLPKAKKNPTCAPPPPTASASTAAPIAKGPQPVQPKQGLGLGPAWSMPPPSLKAVAGSMLRPSASSGEVAAPRQLSPAFRQDSPCLLLSPGRDSINGVQHRVAGPFSADAAAERAKTAERAVDPRHRGSTVPPQGLRAGSVAPTNSATKRTRSREELITTITEQLRPFQETRVYQFHAEAFENLSIEAACAKMIGMDLMLASMLRGRMVLAMTTRQSDSEDNAECQALSSLLTASGCQMPPTLPGGTLGPPEYVFVHRNQPLARPELSDWVKRVPYIPIYLFGDRKPTVPVLLGGFEITPSLAALNDTGNRDAFVNFFAMYATTSTVFVHPLTLLWSRAHSPLLALRTLSMMHNNSGFELTAANRIESGSIMRETNEDKFRESLLWSKPGPSDRELVQEIFEEAGASFSAEMEAKEILLALSPMISTERLQSAHRRKVLVCDRSTTKLEQDARNYAASQPCK
ncbi:BZ3500_MvSof-1268-A1-R1_Chr2-1g04483 [Microbotryum saponariae]|uniref:BZ3500_MvSof-1268-A1-R1_Chr2-1g04483 protein n=1 Tax=Microbotryum saponariae TaxID=289078 RepID=A0A2X0KGT0_9BASI|nr:BZ3500_MvSof-1268-A1-R1_Chr2-1g04483 [Microbotryum saponariae]SCZ91807.1 BZ3501_MvSof-1269-A2-R1_Chr2-1g04139 [Microbotryum saponariae]